MNYLENLNPHPRDANISFEAGPHIYTILGDTDKNKKYVSVTTWNHSHFGEFDADTIITKMMKGENWKKSPYYGQTRKEIKDGWEKNREEAALAGTKMHYDIECYYNKQSVENDSLEYNYFQKFVEACPDLKPYRTEWMIYHEDIQLAGSVDMVYENSDGTLMIYDWKRAKEIKKTDAFMKCSTTECINHLPDTNFWHYALQLNTYKAILEEKYGKIVSKLCLVCLHPNNKNKSFQLIPVPILQKEIQELFELRKQQLTLNDE
jgi:hypothetical protein